MTANEAKQLAAIATAAFPTMQERDMAPTARTWAILLEDLPFELGKTALARVLSQSRYFPTLADIRSAAAEITAADLPTTTEAMMQLRLLARGEILRGDCHPLVAYIVKSVGLSGYQHADDPERSYREFGRQYEAERGRLLSTAALPSGQREKALQAYPALIRAAVTGEKLQALTGGDENVG